MRHEYAFTCEVPVRNRQACSLPEYDRGGAGGGRRGSSTRPSGLDIRWEPADAQASARRARAFAMRATLVHVAEVLSAYVKDSLKSPAGPGLVAERDRADRLVALLQHRAVPKDHIYLGALLVIHWRNRIVHRDSKAGLSRPEQTDLRSELDRFQLLLERHAPATAASLASATQPSVLDNLCRVLVLDAVPRDLTTLCGWRGGQLPDAPPIQGNRVLLSVEAAIDALALSRCSRAGSLQSRGSAVAAHSSQRCR